MQGFVQGGNRRTKTAQVGAGPTVVVEYHYDIDDPETYGTYANRLEYYQTFENSVLNETVWYRYDEEGRVDRIARQPAGGDVVYGIRMEYDSKGQIWRAIGDQWEDPVGEWVDLGDGRMAGLTKATMSWSAARALAVAAGGKLASPENQAELDLLVSHFRPTNNQEVQYWIGGRQRTYASSPLKVHCDYPGGDTPWGCWDWQDYGYPGTSQIVFWEPAQHCGPDPDWCSFNSYGCPEGGWLPGEPDDNPNQACEEDRDENLMVLVLNHRDDPLEPLEHGFADVDSNGPYHGLIVYDTDEGTTYQYQRLWAYEFRYDGGRERYLTRRRNPANPDPNAPGGILDETWTDYDLDGSVYGDYQVAGGGTVTELQRYVPGLAQQSVATGAAEYFLGDQIGTTRFLTDESTPVATTNRRVYTAFGELVEMTGTGQTRYGYAGAWGYQEHDADGANGPDNVLGSPPTGPAIGEVFPFLHVGARYYDPSTGRFLERDPIGIGGGLNTYDYVGARPTGTVDPSGLTFGCTPERKPPLGSEENPIHIIIDEPPDNVIDPTVTVSVDTSGKVRVSVGQKASEWRKTGGRLGNWALRRVLPLSIWMANTACSLECYYQKYFGDEDLFGPDLPCGR